MALLTWLVVYPLITMLLAIFEPLVGIALPLRSFLHTAIMVPAMVYLALPFATVHFRNWLATESMEGTGKGPSDNVERPGKT